MAAALVALRDDDVDAGLLVGQRLLRISAQRRDLEPRTVDPLDYVLRGGAERIGDELHLVVRERDFELGQSRGYRPAQKPSPPLVFGELGHAVVGEELRGEFVVLGGNRGAELLLELLRIELTHALVPVGDDGVDGVGLVADALVDPRQLGLELLRRESHRAEHPHSPGLADGHHDVAAVGEREDRDVNPEKVTDLGSHDGDSPK